MVMRPYQITATERILNRIEIANNYKKYGSVAGGGYIWHTTGERVIIVIGCINALVSRVSGTFIKNNSCID